MKLAIFWILLTSSVIAQELTIIMPLAPPHVFQDGHGRGGEIVNAIFQQCGYQLKPVVVSFGRHWVEYERLSLEHKDSLELDGILTFDAPTFNLQGYKSVGLFRLQDGIVFLKGKGFNEITEVSGLQGFRVEAFKGAAQVLRYSAADLKFLSYKEHSNQKIQINLLLAGRTDVLIADGMIMASYIKTMRPNKYQDAYINNKKRVKFKAIFQPGDWYLKLKDEQIRDRIDQCYHQLMKNGVIKAITKPYLDEFDDILEGQYPQY